jgi:hypothetical protein
VRGLATGGAAAAWRARLDGGLSAQTESEWNPTRSGQALQLHQQFGDSQLGALVASSRTAIGQGARWDLGLSQGIGLSTLSAGIDGAERSYVSSSGGLEPRAGVRLGAQWPLFPHARLEARYTRHVRWDAEEPVSSVMLGTRFNLPSRLSLVTGVETDAGERHKASVTLTVPLSPR